MIDVVIPVYKRKQLLKRAVESVKNQSFSQWKIFVVDDGSQDGTAEDIQREFASDILKGKIEILSLEKNQGVSVARNQGIQKGSNPWVAFLDSDDEWFHHKLEKQLQFSHAHPQFSLIHCDEVWFKNGKQIHQQKKHKKEGGRIFEKSLHLCCISPSAVLMKRSLLEEMAYFREDFPVCEDYDLWLKVTSRYSVGFVSEILVKKYGGHADQLSMRYRAMDYWRVKALVSYLKATHLSQKEMDELKKVLKKKCSILLKGFEKHKNFKNQKEILDIFRKVTES